jgi:hypothetical protein
VSGLGPGGAPIVPVKELLKNRTFEIVSHLFLMNMKKSFFLRTNPPIINAQRFFHILKICTTGLNPELGPLQVLLYYCNVLMYIVSITALIITCTSTTTFVANGQFINQGK